MVGHRSTGLPECGPTESSAPEPCLYFLLFEQNLFKRLEKTEDTLIFYAPNNLEKKSPYQDFENPYSRLIC